MTGMPAPVVVRVIRDGVVESAHRGHVVVADAEGTVAVSLGDPEREVYARSAVKPFQAMGSLDLLDRAGLALDTDGVAIACASHTGSTLHQVEVARLLALADLDEHALRCPPALPWDVGTLLDQRVPTTLAHNCSGKHAGFLLATRAAGADPAAYLDQESPVQRAVRARLAEATSSEPRGPGVDGCGAPAWIVRLAGLATAFARLATGDGSYRRVRDAMTRRPHLVDGPGEQDTVLMLGDHRVVAKSGAEAVLAVGFHSQRHGPLGLATKIEDGSSRATGPVLATALRALGGQVSEILVRPLVLGGGRPHGALEPDPAIMTAIRAAFP
ncbi:MAG: asparaginase [Egibacteraceae bacterium]